MASGASTGRASQTKTIAQVKELELLSPEQPPEYFTVKATIIYIKQDTFAYPACLTKDPQPCNKKVIEVDPDKWRCERCDVTHPRPEYRYIMSANVVDFTGQLWLSCFDESGKMIMGMSADQLHELQETDENAKTEAFHEANCKTYVFRCRAKLETFGENTRYAGFVVSMLSQARKKLILPAVYATK